MPDTLPYYSMQSFTTVKSFIVVALRVVVKFKMFTKFLFFSGTRSAVLPRTAPGLAPRPADPRAARSTRRIPR